MRLIVGLVVGLALGLALGGFGGWYFFGDDEGHDEEQVLARAYAGSLADGCFPNRPGLTCDVGTVTYLAKGVWLAAIENSAGETNCYVIQLDRFQPGVEGIIPTEC